MEIATMQSIFHPPAARIDAYVRVERSGVGLPIRSRGGWYCGIGASHVEWQPQTNSYSVAYSEQEFIKWTLIYAGKSKHASSRAINSLNLLWLNGEIIAYTAAEQNQ